MGSYDTIELLSNLDFVVDKLREHHGQPNKSEVLVKLQPRLKKPQTHKQIDNKIRLLSGNADPKTVEDIYRHGSRRIQNLDPESRIKIQDAVKTIKSEEICIVVSTPRQLRGGSGHTAIDPSSSARGSTIFGERTPTRSSSRHLAIETGRVKRQSASYGEHTPTKTLRRSEGRREPQKQTTKLAKKKSSITKVRSKFEVCGSNHLSEH